jgi:hypothetical protein
MLTSAGAVIAPVDPGHALLDLGAVGVDAGAADPGHDAQITVDVDLHDAGVALETQGRQRLPRPLSVRLVALGGVDRGQPDLQRMAAHHLSWGCSREILTTENATWAMAAISTNPYTAGTMRLAPSRGAMMQPAMRF